MRAPARCDPRPDATPRPMRPPARCDPPPDATTRPMRPRRLLSSPSAALLASRPMAWTRRWWRMAGTQCPRPFPVSPLFPSSARALAPAYAISSPRPRLTVPQRAARHRRPVRHPHVGGQRAHRCGGPVRRRAGGPAVWRRRQPGKAAAAKTTAKRNLPGRRGVCLATARSRSCLCKSCCSVLRRHRLPTWCFCRAPPARAPTSSSGARPLELARHGVAG